MTEPATDNWQRAMYQALAAPPEPHRLRISGAGKCVRYLAYTATGAAPSDPPDTAATVKMALGHALETLIVKQLKDHGWETRYTCIDEGQLELRLEQLPTDPVITGHPDGICRHPQQTNNVWVTLECKSMSPHRADAVANAASIFEVYPEYKAQIALYGAELHKAGYVPYPNYGVFAIMDREGRHLPPQRVFWPDDYAQQIEQRLLQAYQNGQDGHLPDRPFAIDSAPCRFCSYRRHCWQGWSPSPGRNAEPPPETLAAARQWLELQEPLQAARQALEQAVQNTDGQDITVGGVTAGYFYPRDAVQYDAELLAQHLPHDILEQCRVAPRQPRLWIRRSRN